MTDFFAIAASIIDSSASLADDDFEQEDTCEFCRTKSGSTWTGPYEGVWACQDCSWEHEHAHYGQRGRW